MSLFFESIKYQSGKFCNLDGHQERVNRTLKHFSLSEHLDLTTLSTLPSNDDRLYKCRVVYDGYRHDCQWVLYEKRSIDKLVIVRSDPINYAHKYVDRSAIDKLTQGLDKSAEVLICINGVIKDSSYSNLAFLKENTWYTPKSPILNGTKRQRLLDSGKIVPMEIPIESIDDFEKVSLINAMLDLNELVLNIDQVLR